MGRSIKSWPHGGHWSGGMALQITAWRGSNPHDTHKRCTTRLTGPNPPPPPPVDLVPHQDRMSHTGDWKNWKITSISKQKLPHMTRVFWRKHKWQQRGIQTSCHTIHTLCVDYTD